MAEPGKALNRDEMEAAIRNFDNQIQGIRQGMFLSDFNPNSEDGQAAEAALKFYLQQREMMVDIIRELDSTDAF
jgi:hypothetical protein